MTPQEQRILDNLIARIRQTPPQQPRDPDLVQRLLQGLGNSPEALYPLAQAAVASQASLEYLQVQCQQATAELSQWRAQSAVPPQRSGNFLSDFFGTGTPVPQGPPLYQGQPQPYPPSQAVYGQPSSGFAHPPGYAGSSPANPAQPAPGFQPVNAGPPAPPSGLPQQAWGQPQPAYPPPPYSQYPQQAYGQPAGWGAPIPSPGDSMLGRVAETAAGVAAGALVFEGVESVIHGMEGHRNSSEDRNENRSFDEQRGPLPGSGNDSSFYNPHADSSRNAPPAGSATEFADTSGASVDSSTDLDDDLSADNSADDSVSDDSAFDDGDFGGDDNP